MKNIFKSLISIILVVCTLSSVVVLGASESNMDQNVIEPRTNYLAIDSSINVPTRAWNQSSGFIAYRIWIDNTTGALMTVTITSPSGQTKNLYITSGSNQTYTNNNAEPGLYRLSFHTYADQLSGTVRVRVSTTAL